MTKVDVNFSVKELYEMVSSQSTLPSHFILLRQSYQKQNICYLYEHILALQQILQSKNDLPLTKYNALQAVHQMVLTTKYAAIVFMELYLLPIMADISSYAAHKRKEDDLQLYFLEKGYRDSIGIRKIGQKYVKFAAQIIFLVAAIKPFQNIMHKQVQIQSRSAIVATKLKEKMLNYPQGDKIEQVTALRQQYIKQQLNFHPQLFAQFVTARIKQQIIFKSTISPTFKKLVESQDAFITIPIINLCVSNLSNITSHFSQKKVYLSLLNSFIRQGDIYAVVVVHNAIFIEEIFRQIAKVPGDQNISAGSFIYPRIEASGQDKLDFYCEYLKCLMIWAACLPINEIGQISQVSKIYSFLKEEKRFVFPEVVLIKKIQMDFNNRLQQKEFQNDQILKLIDNDEKLLSGCAKWRQSMVQLSLKMDNLARKSEKTQSNNSNTRIFQSLLREAMFRVEGLINEENVSQNMKHLKSFQKEWPGLKKLYESKVSSEIIEQGDKIKKYISDLYPLYLRLKKKSIQFQTFKRKVAALLGFKLSDFALDSYDDYQVDPLNKTSQQESQLNNNSSRHSKSSNSITNLGCWSKVKSVSYEEPINNSSPAQKINSLIKEQRLDDKQSVSNEYGIRELLVKRKRYLNELSQSKQVDRTIKLQDRTIKVYSENILPFYINQSQSINAQTSQDESITHFSTVNSKKSLSQQPIMTDKESKIIQNHNQRVYQVYQIQKKGGSPQQNNHRQSNEEKRCNQSHSLRSRLHLQKIRYSSTRRAIESYAHKVSLSNSSNKNSFNSSRTTSKTIINSQYKRISFQQKRQSLTGEDPNITKQQQFNNNSKTNNSRQHNLIKDQHFVSLQKYREFFPNDNDRSFTKTCIKNKGMLFQNDSIEIGYVNFRKNSTVWFILYFSGLKNVTISSLQLISDANLTIISTYNNKNITIRKDEQKVIKLQVKIKQIPYPLPKIKFNLMAQDRSLQTITFPICSTFNKFIASHLISIQKYESMVFGQQFVCVRCQDVAVNKMSNIHGKLNSFFQLQVLKRTQNVSMMFQCSYECHIAIIEITEQEKKMRIIGFSTCKQVALLQFILSSLYFILR